MLRRTPSTPNPPPGAPRSPLRSALVAALAAAGLATPSAAGQAPPGDAFVPVTDAMLQDPAPGDWLTWRRTLDGWGYSPLDQIDRGNVGDLRMVWSRALAPGRQEGTPLAYGGVLYMPQASDVIEAIDATTGDLVWQHRRNLPDDVYDFVGGNARNNRNIAIYDRFIINTSDDNYAFALATPRPARSRGRRGSSTTGRHRPGTARAPSSPTAGSSPGGAAGPAGARRRASSSPTTP